MGEMYWKLSLTERHLFSFQIQGHSANGQVGQDVPPVVGQEFKLGHESA